MLVVLFKKNVNIGQPNMYFVQKLCNYLRRGYDHYASFIIQKNVNIGQPNMLFVQKLCYYLRSGLSPYHSRKWKYRTSKYVVCAEIM